MTKRKKPQKEQASFKRLKKEVVSFTGSGHTFIGKRRPKQSRKEKRKEERHLKKTRNLAFSQRKPIPTKAGIDKAKQEVENKKRKDAKLQKQIATEEKKKKLKERKKKEAEEELVKQRDIENVYDDREIRDLEKKLGLNKRKKSALPQSFRDDGLDYILDVLDSEKLQDMAAATEQDPDEEGNDFGLMGDDDSEDDDDIEEDFDDQIDDDGSESDVENGEQTTELTKLKPSKTSKTVEDNDTDKPVKAKWEELAERIQKVVDKKKHNSKTSVKFEDENDSEIDGSEENNVEISDSNSKKSKPTKHVTFIDDNVNDDSDESDDLHEEFDDNEFSEDDINASNNDSDGNQETNENIENDSDNIENSESDNDENSKLENLETKASDLKEDIYGRLRDAEGNIVKDNAPAGGGSYVPPAKRLKMAASSNQKSKLQNERLQKQLKGLVNRTSENNIQPISSQIEDLYLTNSRADVNESLIQLIFDACVSTVMTPDRLAMELMMLVAILHGNVGSEVGAVLLQHLVKKFHTLHQETTYGVGKLIDNVVVLLAHLYNFKVVHSVLVFDIVNRLVDSFKERDIELLLLILRNVGFTLRKDDPNGLKGLIVKIQSAASSEVAVALMDQSRVRFMLDIILAIRNNNMRKIPNYDHEHLEHLRKLIRAYIRGGHFGDNQLHITLDDLLLAEDKGKWWVVGSAWQGQGPRQQKDTVITTTVLSGLEISTKLQELAQKQRMNTDTRRNIFFIIMTSEDYIDAFEKLLRLGLKSNQPQEIVLVILDCCLQEKTYNPFYAHLGQKFCQHHRSYQMAFQFSLWDRFKELGQLKDSHRHNLAKLLAHLITSKALSLALLKVVQFGTLEKSMVRLLKQLFTEILLEHPQEVIEAVFTRISQLDKLKTLHEGLKLFLQHFLIGRKKDESQQNSKLLKRVEIVDRLLSSRKNSMLL